MAINVDIAAITGINQVGNSYQRKSAVPLDYYSLFNTKAEAEAYAASNPVSYVGQVISYIDNNEVKVCVIANAAGLLKEVGTAPVGDNKTIEVSTEGAVALLGAATAANGTLPMLEEVEEDGKKVSKLVWKTLEDIGAGDGNDNTTYEFTFADQKITITPKFNGVAQTAQVLDLTAFITADELKEVTGEVAEGKTLVGLIAEALAEAKKYADDNDANDNTEYHIEYDSDKKEIKLVAGADAGKMTIDATPFIKDGMLHDVSYDAASNTLTFIWNTDEGSKEDTVVLSDIIDPYTAGNGLDLNGNKFSVKIDADSEEFLTVGENGVKLAGVQDAIDDALEAAKQYADGKEHKNTTYDLSSNGVTITLTPSEGAADSVTLDAYTKSETDNKIDEKIASVTGGESAADVKLALESYRDALNKEVWGEDAGSWTTSKTEDGKTVVTYTPAYGTESRIDKLEKVGAQANVIETVKVNGVALTPDADKAVNVTVPTDVKELTDADNKYLVNVRMRENGEGYTSKLAVNKVGNEAVIDDSAVQYDIAQVKVTADAAVQSADFAGKAMTKEGTKLAISQADARDALGLKSAAYKDENAFAPAGDYKTKQAEKTGTLAGAQVVDTWTQNANGELAITTRNLTPADIGAQPAGNYQPVGDYKTKQTAVADPTAAAYDGSVLSYIETLTQNENGEISATKRSFDMAAYIQKTIGDATNIMNFRGVVEPTDAGFAADIATITSPVNGDVVLYGEYEYIYNGTKWEQFGDATGAIATAKDYTDKEIAKIHSVDGDTIKLKDNKAYVAKVSTDVLVQGEQELVLCGGNAFGFASN